MIRGRRGGIRTTIEPPVGGSALNNLVQVTPKDSFLVALNEFVDIDDSTRPRGAMDKAPLQLRSYGFCAAPLFNNERPHEAWTERPDFLVSALLKLKNQCQVLNDLAVTPHPLEIETPIVQGRKACEGGKHGGRARKDTVTI